MVYVRMLGTGEVVKPLPHVLVDGGCWEPYIATLVRCMDCVSLLLFDIERASVVEVADIEIDKLQSTDIMVTDQSLFDNSYGFHIRLRPTAPAFEELMCRHHTGSESGSLCMSTSESHTSSMSRDSSGGLVDAGISDAQQSDENDSSPETLTYEPVCFKAYPTALYLTTRRAFERNEWVACLRAHCRPTISGPVPLPLTSTCCAPLMFRVDRSIWLKINRTSGFSKTCDTHAIITLDGIPMAQTSVIFSTSEPKWDTMYYFGCLPRSQSLHVFVCHKEQDGLTGGLLGYCRVPVSAMQRKQLYDGWYPLVYGDVTDADEAVGMYLPLEVNVRPEAERHTRHVERPPSYNKPSVSRRSSARSRDSEPAPPRRYQSDDVLNMCQLPSMPFRSADLHIQARCDDLIVLTKPFYRDTIVVLLDTQPTLIFDLVAILPQSADWLVETITKLAISSGKTCSWISAVIAHEIATQTVPDPTLLFRSTSVATRTLDTLMKTVGLQFVDLVIGDVVRNIVYSDHYCEVDPSRLEPNEVVAEHWSVLVALLRIMWSGIEDNMEACPRVLCRIFTHVRQAAMHHLDNVEYSCISGFVFLRLICPAIVSPKSFGIVERMPGASACRTLLLMAKGMQCAANLTDFTMKEPYMQPMSAFVDECKPGLKRFIDFIASAPQDDPLKDDFEGASMVVDMEREAAALCACLNAARKDIEQVAVESEHSEYDSNGCSPVSRQSGIYLRSLLHACSVVQDCVEMCTGSMQAADPQQQPTSLLSLRKGRHS
ncbi:GTPase activating factor [Linderina pennispora]|nr:GTPase activating factor [Linderina pennispora]